MCELGGGSCFSGAIYAYHDDDVWEAIGAWFDGGGVFWEDAGDVFFSGVYNIFCADFTTHGLEFIDDGHRESGSEVCGDEICF